MPREITGKYLNELWGIGAKHALYSHNGTWYHQLKKFPGALCDSEGYVIFETLEDFTNCLYLRVKQDVGCVGGIRKIPSYIRCDSQVANDVGEPSKPNRVDQRVTRIVRDTALSSELKLLYDHMCQLCGEVIKLCGKDYSEAHHIKPLGKPHDGNDKQNNLVCVCPNCHVQLDYAAIPFELSMLKVLKHKIDSSNIDYHNKLHTEALSKITTKKLN